MEEKDNIILHRSIYRQLQHFINNNKTDEALSFIIAIMKYGFEGEEPPIDDEVWMYGFESSRDIVDSLNNKEGLKNCNEQVQEKACGRPKALSLQDEQKIAAYRRDGYTAIQIGELLGVNEKTVRRTRGWKEYKTVLTEEHFDMNPWDISVYRLTLPNNKVYIGISNNPEVRWSGGNGYKNNKEFYADIQKYGWENVKKEILFSHLNRVTAEEMETSLIQQYPEDRLYNKAKVKKD